MHQLLPIILLATTSCSYERSYRPLGDPNLSLPDPGAVERGQGYDRIMTASPPEVDLLWVIDDSCSMSCVIGCHSQVGVQDALLGEFDTILREIEASGLDYHIGVVTSDADSEGVRGVLRETIDGDRYISPATVDPLDAFADLVLTGTNGRGEHEKLRDAALIALTEHQRGTNEGFAREGSSTHIVAVTNEPDYSNRASQDEFVAWLDSYRPPAMGAYHAIECTEGDRYDERCAMWALENSEWAGRVEYPHEVTERVGGGIWSILDADWTEVAAELGSSVAGARSEFFLSRIPVPGTVRCTVVGIGGVDCIWHIRRNSVTLPDPVAPGTVVHISYDIAS